MNKSAAAMTNESEGPSACSTMFKITDARRELNYFSTAYRRSPSAALNAHHV